MLGRSYAYMWRGFALGLVTSLFPFICLTLPAASQNFEVQANSCQDRRANNNQRIDACTWLINSGKLKKEGLVIAHLSRSDAYHQKGEYRRAISDCDQAIFLDPNKPEAYTNRGLAYDNLGQHQRAIQDFDQAAKLDSKSVVLFNNRGFAYANLNRYERALEDYDRALNLNPNYVITYVNRGNAYFRLRRYHSAILDYSRASELDPEYASAYNNLAWLRATAADDHYRDGAEAVRLAHKALQLDKNALEIRRTIAVALIANNEPDLALAAYREAMAMGGEQQIRDYQNDLKRKGFYRDIADGKLNAATDEALKACVVARCKLMAIN